MRDIYEAKDKQYEYELNLWATFYLSFNDDNVEHMDQALLNNLATGKLKPNAESIHTGNVAWVVECHNKGITTSEILDEIPEAKPYIEEIDGKVA